MPKTILLVEDELIIALSEKRWLNSEGYDVIHVVSGESAIKSVHKNADSIDIILMDIDLGDGIDGISAARQILKDHDIPLLFLSSHPEKETIEKTGDVTSYGYIEKRPDKTLMLASIKMAFKLHMAYKELKRKESSLRESEENFRQLVENTGEGIGFMDLDETFRFVNPAGEMIFGVEKGMLKGRKLEDFVDPDNFQKIREQTQIRQQGKKSVYEISIIRPDGKKRTVIVTGTPRYDNNGNFIGTFGIFSDITERKNALKTLCENQTKLRRVVEGSSNTFWAINLSTREVEFMGQLKEEFPFLKEELEIRNPPFEEILNLCHPLDKNNISGMIKEVLEGQRRLFDIEFRARGRSGEWIWIHATGRIVTYDEQGNPLVFSGSFSNINERKNTEEEIKRINEKMSKLIETKDKLFSIISHDLKGPFAGFLGLTEALSSGLDFLSKEDIQQYSSVMHSTARRLYELLTNLLEWSKVQTGQISFIPVVLNLSLEAEKISDLFSSSAKNKSINFINEVAKDTLVYADPNMLSLILRNLASNAIKFTNPGGRVLITSRGSEESVEISIMDSGIGMTTEVLSKLFSVGSGFTTKGTKGEEGSGLGLVLCKDLIEKNGGEIIVQSIPQVGTCFTFTLPSASTELLKSKTCSYM